VEQGQLTSDVPTSFLGIVLNRSRMSQSFSLQVDVRQGEAVVATGFVHPQRGLVACPAAPLLGGGLNRAGLPVRYGRVETARGGPARLETVTYLDREERAWGLAVATAPGDNRVARLVNSHLRRWAQAMRTRRLVLGAPDRSCPGHQVPRGPDSTGRCMLGDAAAAEVRRLSARGDTVLVAGGPQDAQDWPADVHALVARWVRGTAAAARVDLPDAHPVAVVCAPGLPVQVAAQITALLRDRFPALVPQHPGTHCHGATDALSTIRTMTAVADLVLVPRAGASALTVERTAAPMTVPVHHVDTAQDIRASWLEGAACVAVAPPALNALAPARELLLALTGLGPAAAVECRTSTTPAVLPIHPASLCAPRAPTRAPSGDVGRRTEHPADSGPPTAH